MVEYQEKSKEYKSSHSHVAKTNPRFEAAYILRRHGISCIIWSEDALHYYGSRTICFDLILLVADLQAASQCLLSNNYSRALPNPRYEFISELHALPRFTKGPFSEAEDEDATYISLILASEVYYDLPPANIGASAAISYDDLLPPVPALIDSLIDAWLDATTLMYTAHLASHLSYLHECCPRATDPLIVSELKPGHREMYRGFLASPDIGRHRVKWRQVRDSFVAEKPRQNDTRGVEAGAGAEVEEGAIIKPPTGTPTSPASQSL